MPVAPSLPEKIRRIYATLNKSVVRWWYTTLQMDRITVDLGGKPPVLADWEHNGMSWQPVKSVKN